MSDEAEKFMRESLGEENHPTLSEEDIKLRDIASRLYDSANVTRLAALLELNELSLYETFSKAIEDYDRALKEYNDIKSSTDVDVVQAASTKEFESGLDLFAVVWDIRSLARKLCPDFDVRIS